ncbi:MAG: hypothetical protein LBB22_02920 [Treponema sp.]|jgi:hypothetical protein|nr:hypothetical protein [Treponema sp.]
MARKVAVSLLICVLIFAGFCFLSFTRLFDIIEARFYDRAILNDLTEELTADTEIVDNYMNQLKQRFLAVLSESSIRNSFWVNQSSDDIWERGRIFASLSEAMPGLQWVRFVDAAGNRMHYSTNPDDQIQTSGDTVFYKNYPEAAGYIPFDQQLLSNINMQRIVFDGGNERLIFFYPFYDSMDIRRGEALFSVSINAFGERLMENAQIKIGEDVSVISEPNGIVIGIPALELQAVKELVSSIWSTGGILRSRIYGPRSGALALLSAKTSDGIYVGRVVPEKLFYLPDSLKALFITAVFITLFVIMFLILNMKQDPIAVVQGRLKELQVSLMNEYYQLMGDMDWAVWRRELEQRRQDVKAELCRGVKIKKGSDVDGYINSFFNRSWDGLLAAIGSRTGMMTTFDEAKLEAILSRVLSSVKRSELYDDSGDFPSTGSAGKDEFDEIEEISDAEEILEAEMDELEAVDDDTPPAATVATKASSIPKSAGIPKTAAKTSSVPKTATQPLPDSLDAIEELDEAVEPEDIEEIGEDIADTGDILEFAKSDEVADDEPVDEFLAVDNPVMQAPRSDSIEKTAYSASALPEPSISDPYDVEEFEEIEDKPLSDDDFIIDNGQFNDLSNAGNQTVDDNGLYDVEEFDDVASPQSRMPSPPTQPVPKTLDANEYGNQDVFDETIASAAPYPKPNFDEVLLKVYDPNVYITSILSDGTPQTSDGTESLDDESGITEEIDRPEGEEYEDISEIDEAEPLDELIPPQETQEELEAALEEDASPLEDAPATEAATGNADTSQSQHDIEWLKLAGEAAALEPENIWAELSSGQETPKKPAATPEKKVRQEPGIELSSDILEDDPFGRVVFTNNVNAASKNPPINILTTKEPAYGEFIPVAVEEAKPKQIPQPEASGSPPSDKHKSVDSIYDVEEFAEVDNDADTVTPVINNPAASVIDEYTFESPRKGMDINEIAKKIEFSPMPKRANEQSDDFDLDVSSPVNELFAGKATGSSNKVSGANNNQPKPDANGSEKSVIKKRGGVDYIDSAALREAVDDTKGVDPEMKNLVDSVLKKPQKPLPKTSPKMPPQKPLKSATPLPPAARR